MDSLRLRRATSLKMSEHTSTSERLGLVSRGSSAAPLIDETKRVDVEEDAASQSGGAASLQDNDNILERLQQIANIVSHALALLAVMLVIWWISLLGGLSWQEGQAKKVFNWHPLLMICCFSFMTVSALSFRFPLRADNRNSTKLLHGVSWAVAALCAAVALVAVLKSHNDAKSGFIANLYSLHSWIGSAVILLYVGQFVVGALSFGRVFGNILLMSSAQKAKIMKLHKFAGSFIYNLTAATILLGIQEKEGFVSCSYPVSEADTFPLVHLFKIPNACLVSHALGIVVLLMALSTSFAIHDF